MGEEDSVDVYYSHIKQLSDARIGELRDDATTRSIARAARAARNRRRVIGFRLWRPRVRPAAPAIPATIADCPCPAT